MKAYLEETVAKYLHPSNDYISLTEIARKFDADHPSYITSNSSQRFPHGFPSESQTTHLIRHS